MNALDNLERQDKSSLIYIVKFLNPIPHCNNLLQPQPTPYFLHAAELFAFGFEEGNLTFGHPKFQPKTSLLDFIGVSLMIIDHPPIEHDLMIMKYIWKYEQFK